MPKTDASPYNSRNVLRAFFLGDALGEAFEFSSPSKSDIARRWNSDVENLRYTDDSILVASTLEALPHWDKKTNSDAAMERAVLDFMASWWDSKDLRGIGETTQAALRQIADHRHRKGHLVPFQIDESQYPKEISAGNGILSRVLPIGVEPATDVHWKKGSIERFLMLTHLHEDGHESAKQLLKWMKTGGRHPLPKEPWADGTGFYAPETLWIAGQCAKAKSPFRAFEITQVEDGDNDSTAALGMALWVFNHGWDQELDRLEKRFVPVDRKTIGKWLARWDVFVEKQS